MSRNPVEWMSRPDQLYYWIPGEMVVVIRLPGQVKEEAQEELVEQVRSQLNATLAPFKLTLEAYRAYGRRQETPSMPPVRRRWFVFGLHQQQGSTSIRGNGRATIKAHPATPHHPRPYGNRVPTGSEFHPEGWRASEDLHPSG
jgi:hypothetical protein